MRMKLRKRIYISIYSKIVITLIIICFLVYSFINKFSIASKKYLDNYAYNEALNIATTIINNSVNIDNTSELVTIEKNDSNEIINLKYNDKQINNILNNITNNLINNIKLIESTNNSYYIPLGVIYNIPILTDLSPLVPLKISFIGSTNSSIETNIKEYGINNSLVQICIRIDLNMQVILPFVSKNVNITKTIPISTNVIEGLIPEYYGGNLSYSSKIY